MLTLRRVKRILEIAVTVIAVALVVIEKLEKG